MGAPRKGTPDAQALDEHLDELERLADTAGADVVGRVTQRVEAPDPGTYIGRGKLEQLKAEAEAQNASLIIFDEELSPGQGHHLEQALERRVMDRPELILDIFALRAQSHEARTQVELAQLEYMLPRLMRMWTHLSRIRGGIGLRGPGETQLETDRRMIGRKISKLKRELKHVAAHRANMRRGRDTMLQAALVGYTNAGKSSILNALAGSEEAFVEDRLFATLDTTTREVELGDGYRARVIDTVGFIRKLPHHLVASFRATLEEAETADLLLHVVDAAHPDHETQVSVVERVLGDLGLGARPTLYVFNKLDQVPDPNAFTEGARARYPWVAGVVAGGAKRETGSGTRTGEDGRGKGEGIEPLRGELRAFVRSSRPVARIMVPVTDGALLASIHRDAEVVGQVQGNGVMVLTARVDQGLLGRLRREGVEVVVGEE